VREEKTRILTGKSLARLQNSWESLMDSEVTLDVDKKSISICSTNYFLFRGVSTHKEASGRRGQVGVPYNRSFGLLKGTNFCSRPN
jgi:hypothetical protein